MKRLTSMEDIPYSIEIRPSSLTQPGASWGQKLVILATVVSSDGFVRDEVHAVEFGDLNVTKRSVTARWSYGSLARPDQPRRYDDGRPTTNPWHMREIILPRNNSGQAAYRKLSRIRDRLVTLLAPQHSWLVEERHAMRFCLDVHNHIVVQDVMTS